MFLGQKKLTQHTHTHTHKLFIRMYIITESIFYVCFTYVKYNVITMLFLKKIKCFCFGQFCAHLMFTANALKIKCCKNVPYF